VNAWTPARRQARSIAFRVGGRRAHPAATARDALDLELPHQPGDALLADRKAVTETQLGMQAGRAVGLVGVLPGQRGSAA
jgi:hypothetical protein